MSKLRSFVCRWDLGTPAHTTLRPHGITGFDWQETQKLFPYQHPFSPPWLRTPCFLWRFHDNFLLLFWNWTPLRQNLLITNLKPSLKSNISSIPLSLFWFCPFCILISVCIPVIVNFILHSNWSTRYTVIIYPGVCHNVTKPLIRFYYLLNLMNWFCCVHS